MFQLTEAKAEKFSTAQATELIRVLELQAGWENHCDDPAKSAVSNADLNVRRKAFDAFQAAKRAYDAKYGTGQVPDPTRSMPDRLAIWCRVLRAICQRAEGVCRVQLMAKVYRLTDRNALRLGKERLGRGIQEGMAAVIRELTMVIAWCEAAAIPSWVILAPATRCSNHNEDELKVIARSFSPYRSRGRDAPEPECDRCRTRTRWEVDGLATAGSAAGRSWRGRATAIACCGVGQSMGSPCFRPAATRSTWRA